MKAIKEYDHIISLGLNCETSYQMRMKHGAVESHLLSWAAVHSKSLISIIKDPHIIFSGEIRDMADYNMWECAITDIAFHGWAKVEELLNEDGSRNMEKVIKEKEDTISRVNYLSNKLAALNQSSDSKLYVLGLQPNFIDCQENEVLDFVKNVWAALKEHCINASLLVIAEPTYEHLQVIDNNEDVFVRLISKFAPFDRVADPGCADLISGGKIFDEFRTRFSPPDKDKKYKFER